MKLVVSRFHFIGIGGIGMSGLAELLHNMGAKVTGSDLAINAQVERLESLGIRVFRGHEDSNVGDVDVVVYSSAVPANNPEFLAARKRRIPIIPRAEVLAEVMRLKRGIAVGGSHGKTTTTSMLASIFIHSNMDPTVVVGGRLDMIKSTSLLGKGDWLIAEADESDGSFLRLNPEIAIITNVDNDHLDHYKVFSNLQKAFVDFGHKVPFYGVAIVCGDDPQIRPLFKDFNKKILFYGFESQNDFRIEGSSGVYSIFSKTDRLGEIRLAVPGHHNALNALASIVAGLEAGLSFDQCAKGVAAYAGVDRRLQSKGIVGGVEVIDDYGHHPTEVAAVIQALREKYLNRRLVVWFQPHRYSRTQSCWDNFLTCFNGCDLVRLLDIYSAGEAPIENISSDSLAKAIQHPNCRSVGPVKNGLGVLSNEIRAGDVVVTLGAGDIWKLGPALLDILNERAGG